MSVHPWREVALPDASLPSQYDARCQHEEGAIARACYANFVHGFVTAIDSSNNARLRPLPAIRAHATTHLTSSGLDQVLEWKGEQGTNEIHNMLAEHRTREWGAADLSFNK